MVMKSITIYEISPTQGHDHMIESQDILITPATKYAQFSRSTFKAFVVEHQTSTLTPTGYHWYKY